MPATSSSSSESEILARLLELNARRRRRTLAAGPDRVHDPSTVDREEDFFAREFGAARRLAAYGSLAPGRANHHHLAALGGEWRAGLTVEGVGSGAGVPGAALAPGRARR